MVKEDILGYKVNAFSVDACIDQLFQSLQAGKRTWLACFNPHSYAIALKDKVFASALKDADWLVPDGSGVLLASRILGGDIKARVAGSDVFAGLNKRMDATGGISVFFLGSDKETLSLITKKMKIDYPNIKIAGTFTPPFKNEFLEDDSRTMADAINISRPDVLWVGMSAPKQEKWIYLNKYKLNVKFVGAVGAVFDFYSGKIKRDKDSWLVNHGLEWLPRLLQEPKRLWKRMFVSAPVFMWHVVKQRFKS